MELIHGTFGSLETCCLFLCHVAPKSLEGRNQLAVAMTSVLVYDSCVVAAVLQNRDQ